MKCKLCQKKSSAEFNVVEEYMVNSVVAQSPRQCLEFW